MEGGGGKTSANKVTYGTGKTGVELCFHKPNEYKQLNGEQKEELRLWRQSTEGKEAVKKEKIKKNNGGRTLKKSEIAAINALIKLNSKKVAKKADNADEASTEDESDKEIAAVALKCKKIMKRTRFSEDA